MLVKPLPTAGVLLLMFGGVIAGAEGPPAPRFDAQGDPLPDEAISRLGTTRLRDGGYVDGLAFSPDGKTLISDGSDGVRTWDAATGRQLHHLGARRFSLSPDGKWLALPLDRGIRLVELDGGKEARWFGSKETAYFTVRFAHDGKKLAALCGLEVEGTFGNSQIVQTRLEIWDATKGQKLNSWDIGGRGYLVRNWLGWPEGKTPIVANYYDNKFRLWDADLDGFRHELPVGELTVEDGLVAFSPDGARLAAVSDDRRTRRIRVWDVATGKETRQFGAYEIPTGLAPPDYPDKYLQVVAFTPDGKALVTGSAGGAAVFWDADTGAEIRRYALGLSSPRALAVSPDGKTLAAVSLHTIHLFDLTTGKERLPQIGLEEGVASTAVSADGRIAATASARQIVLWDAATGKELRRLQGLPDNVAGIQTAADGRSLVSLGYDSTWQPRHTLQTWELPGGKEHHRAEWPSKESERPQLLALAPDGKTAAVGLGSNPYPKMLALVDRNTGKELRRFDLKDERALFAGVAFTPDSRTLTAWTYDRLVRLWDLPTGRLLRRFPLVGKGYVAAVSSDGRHLLFGSQEPFLALYDVAEGRELARTEKLDDNPNNGRLMAFSPDGKMFAWKGSYSCTVYLTETATLRERHRFTAPQGEITTLTFAADGRTLLTGNGDTTALVWDLTGRLREKEAWGRPLAAADLDACWSDLTGDDAPKAYGAVQKLAGSAAEAAAYLKSHLRPVPALDEARVGRLIADLDGDDFGVRESANKELEKMEEVASRLCRKALDGAPSPEARRRLEGLVQRQADRWRQPTGPRLQRLRGLEVLEAAGTPEARQVLEALAQGAPEADVTAEAKASLERLTRRAE